jgi:uncharacterized protein
MKYFAPTKLSENISETPEGYLLCSDVPIARTGEYEYGPGETPIEVGSNGKVIIVRSEKEVFAPKTIASFEGKPFTIRHPEDFVEPENWKELAKGIIQNIRRGEGHLSDCLVADILVTDLVAISLVKSGMRGLSCGYEAEYIEIEKGRGEQTDIVGNHVALVDEGRAGPSFKIKDQKGISSMKNKFAEKLKSMFSQTIDKAIEDEEKSEGKVADEEKALDELVKMVKDLGEKVSVLAGSKAKDDDEETERVSESKGKGHDDDDDKAKDDDDAEGEGELLSRIKALEEVVAKLVERESKEEEVSVDDEEEEAEDDDDTCDDDDDKAHDEEMSKATDEKSRAEILAPGIKAFKGLKVKALKAAYGTRDGKKVIDSLTGGKSPSYDNKKEVEVLFVAASELLKKSRSNEFSNTRRVNDDSSSQKSFGIMTAEKMNEINAKAYQKK